MHPFNWLNALQGRTILLAQIGEHVSPKKPRTMTHCRHRFTLNQYTQIVWVERSATIIDDIHKSLRGSRNASLSISHMEMRLRERDKLCYCVGSLDEYAECSPGWHQEPNICAQFFGCHRWRTWAASASDQNLAKYVARVWTAWCSTFEQGGLWVEWFCMRLSCEEMEIYSVWLLRGILNSVWI